MKWLLISITIIAIFWFALTYAWLNDWANNYGEKDWCLNEFSSAEHPGVCSQYFEEAR